MTLNIVPTPFDVADWNTGAQSSIAAGVATINGIGGPAANSINTMDTYEWATGVVYTVRVKMVTFADLGSGTFRVLVDGVQHTFTPAELPPPNGTLEFTFIGAGNTTNFDFRTFSLSCEIEDPFVAVIVAAVESPPANYFAGDVLLFQTVNNGDINRSGGVIEMTPDFRTAVYLSLFGGNRDDDGSAGTNLSWWGNASEQDPSRQYRSEFQHLIDKLPLTSANLLLFQDAAGRDLQWFLDMRVASLVEAVATIPRINTLQLVVHIEAFGREEQFTFTENWKAST